MRVSAYVSVAAFGTAALSAVAPLSARQADVITGILSDVGSKIEGVNSAVTSYDGSNSAPVVDAGKTLVTTINNGITTAKGSEDLTLEGALELQEPVKDLTNKASTLVDNLTSKRDAIAKQGECGTTRTLVGEIDSSSNELINAVVAKVPQEAQSIAEGLVADLKDVLAKAKTNFNEANCVDAAGGGSSSAPAPSAQPTGGASSAPASSAPAPSAPGSSAPASSAAPSAQPTGGASSAPASSAAPTAKPTGGASSGHASVPSGTGTAVVPPHVTPSGPVVVPTAGAGSLLPPGLIAMGIAAAML